ncbi:MAG: hypothetical protein H0U65_01075 [Rubrobacter sp.]|nr:hypothetical protein [Rubrobacter sp.]
MCGSPRRFPILRKPDPLRDTVRLPASAFQPVAHDSEDGPRMKLSDVEVEKLVEKRGRKLHLREPSSIRALRELAK